MPVKIPPNHHSNVIWTCCYSIRLICVEDGKGHHYRLISAFTISALLSDNTLYPPCSETCFLSHPHFSHLSLPVRFYIHPPLFPIPQNYLRPASKPLEGSRALESKFCLSVRRNGSVCSEAGIWDSRLGEEVSY